jgi:hypothetical protein
MSFDLFLSGFEHGDVAPANRAAVLQTLRRHSDVQPDDFGFYRIEFTDGSSTELNCKELEGASEFTNCMFHMRSFSPAEIQLVYEVAVAGDMVIFNPQGDDSDESPSVILIHAAQRVQLTEQVAQKPRLIGSALELGVALGADVSRWQAYRDR